MPLPNHEQDLVNYAKRLTEAQAEAAWKIMEDKRYLQLETGDAVRVFAGLVQAIATNYATAARQSPEE
jgi:hypothetical protein